MKSTSKGIIMSTLAPSFLFQPRNGFAASANHIFAENDVNKRVSYFSEFTETYRKYSHNIYRRELECLKLQIPRRFVK